MRSHLVAPSSAVRFECLEQRAFCSTTPAHLALAERSVAEVTPANNLYYNGTPTVTWSGLNGATVTSVKADCTTYVTTLLKTADGYTNQNFINWMGASSPSLTKYYNAAIADSGLTGFTQISNLQPGDLFISKYADTTVALGHMAIIDAAPVLVSTTATQRIYNLTVIDVTSDVHSNDTRTVIDPTTGVHDTGVGRGTLRVYTDLNGNLQTWSWGTSKASTIYDPTQRPATFAKIPHTSVEAPDQLTATGTSGNVSLTWADESDHESGYVVQRSLKGSTTWTALTTTAPDTTAFTDTTAGLASYSYRVYSTYGSLVSAYSNTAGVNTAPHAPAAPTNLVASLSGVTNITLTWQDNADNETMYIVERSIDGIGYSLAAKLPANTTTWTNTDLATGHTYSYRVRADNTLYMSGYATPAAATIPSMVTSVTSTSIAKNLLTSGIL